MKKKIMIGLGIASLATNLMVFSTASGLTSALERVEDEKALLQESLEERKIIIDEQTLEIEKNRKKVDGLEKDLKSTKEELVKKQKRLSEIKRKTIKVKVTGYCPCSYCCGEWAYKNPGITASGTRAKYGTVAAPKSLPFGTKMKIEGYGDKIFTVEDTGSAVVYKNGVYVIDMWMPTHAQAYAIGNKIVEATIIN